MKITAQLINATQQNVLSSLGEPLKKTNELGSEVWWYNSRVPGYTDALTFSHNENGEAVVSLISLQNNPTPSDLQTFLSTQPQPTETLLAYDPQQYSDSLQKTVHIWSDQGLAIITADNIPSSSVVAIYYSNPGEIKKILQQKQILSSNVSVQTVKEESPKKSWQPQISQSIEVAPLTKIELTSLLLRPYLPFFLLTCGILAIGVVGLVFWKKRKNTTPTNSPASPSQPQ